MGLRRLILHGGLQVHSKDKLLVMAFQRRMHALPFSDIQVTDTFWSNWQNKLIEVTLPAQYDQLIGTGRLENFIRTSKGGGEFQGLWFNDSDVYKFLEACAYALTIRKDQKLLGYIDEITELISAAQADDGYINTYIQLKFPNLRFRNLHMMHEMYCGGHLIEAGVAVQQCLGDERLLNVGIRFADHLSTVFGPEKRQGYCGHEEIELALIRLSEATENSKYRELARWMVESRGQGNSPFVAELADQEATAMWPHGSPFEVNGKYVPEYSQDHAPIREHTKVVGHAVRAMYLYIAAAELASGENDSALEEALERAWNNLVHRRMYVTGGIGPSASNEGFTTDFDLPNLSAYAETCASCGLVFWGQKMLELTGNSDYAEVTERALFNGVLSGISISGDQYFYANPLESRGTHKRTPWFTCACCPPNIARLIGSISQYVASIDEEGLYLHIPVGIQAKFTVSGEPVTIEVESDYPWSGKFKVNFKASKSLKFKLRIRIPEWSEEMETELPGAEEPADYDSGYAVFDRVWKDGDSLTVDLGMEPKWIEADPRVRDNLGRIALLNGPLVYALEEHDLGVAPQLFSPNLDALPEVTKSKVLGGINVISIDGQCDTEFESDDLYLPEGSTPSETRKAKFIPYFAWNNRGPNNMVVWVRRG